LLMEDHRTVCVTGATGFIAGHVVEEFMAHGYHVHATSRSAGEDNPKLKHLIALRDKYPDAKLTFFTCDLSENGSFDKAIKGCQGVVHVASPTLIGRMKDPKKDFIDPAVNGTLNILNSCQKHPEVEKIVLTSSVATCNNGPNYERQWTEKDQNKKCSLSYSPYSLSKCLAEKAAHDWNKSLGNKYKIPTIHPSMVLGPQQSDYVTSSNLVISLVMSGAYPLFPQLYYSTVDVRDVARAHRVVLENEESEGRYILSNGEHWTTEIRDILLKKYSDYPLPTTNLPHFLLRLVALFDSKIDKAMLEDHTTKSKGYDGSKITKEQDFEYEFSFEESVLDSAQSMVELGIVDKKKKKKNLLLPIVLVVLLLVAVFWFLF